MQSKFVITEAVIKTAWIHQIHQPKSSLKSIEMELNISKTSIYRILTKHLGLRKVCSRFDLHKLTENAQNSSLKDLIKKSKYNRNLLYKILTGDETLCFQCDPETKRQSAKWMHPDETLCSIFIFATMHQIHCHL